MSNAENDAALQQMVDILRKDFNIAAKAVEARDTPYRRRNIVRTFAAAVEGHTSVLLQWVMMVVESMPKKSFFTDAEMALIKDESYRLARGGKVTTAPARLPKVEAFLFSLEMYSKFWGYPLGSLREGNGWDSFCRALNVRDRLTHPQTASDLEVTSDELSAVAQAAEWWVQTYDRVHREAPRHFAEQVRRMKKGFRSLKKRRFFLGKAGGQPDA